MEKTKPTREQFLDYLRIKDSGWTNIFAVNIVCDLSYEGLTKGICCYIMEHFESLLAEYGINK